MSDREEQNQPSVSEIRLEDYRPPEFTTDHVNLEFDIYDDYTIVRSTVTYKRTEDGAGASELVLDAEDPTPKDSPDYIRSVKADDMALSNDQGYVFDSDHDQLRIPVDPDRDEITVEIETYLEPQANTKLEGLYKGGESLMTQCESLGFRRITPFLDRPDVLAKYDVTINAPKDSFPVLLSNGNKVDSGDLGNGRHWARFYDPFAKPSYLFATVDGPLDWIERKYTTNSGRTIHLYVYTDTGDADAKGWHAMDSLEQSMRWDEETFGLEYDLDEYHVAATARFSMGAMENKGLNLFRDILVLANPEIATDRNYQLITDVIGHEYFHNYTGNRVTLRDWFQLSVKEGLTVNREQMFTAYTTSPATQRIQAVQTLRSHQFPEDDGPIAHPVKPPSIREVDNIYSGTVYEKGSEVIRMMKTMMGEDTFIHAVQDYLDAYDGQAVTIDDFVESMEKASGLDFSGQFYLWYTQSGRPRVKAEGHYDPDSKTYTLTLKQHTPPTNDQAVKEAMYIPVTTALIDDDGNEIPLQLAGDTGNEPEHGAGERVLHFTQDEQTFVFKGVESEPAIHSLFRGFSAPVDCEPGLSDAQLHEQLRKDTDGFNRWDAGQKLALREMERLYNAYIDNGAMPDLDSTWLESLRRLVNDREGDPALTATALSLPGINELESRVKPADPQAVAAVRKHMRQTIASELADEWQQAYDHACRETDKPYSFNYTDSGYRSIKRMALGYLTENGEEAALQNAYDQYFAADNMTDRMAAMTGLMDHDSPKRGEVFDAFYQHFKGDGLTIQKYFGMRAMSNFDGVIEELEALAKSDVFDWTIPGHVQNLYRGFSGNYEQFHRPDGLGYRFLADGVLKEVPVNGTTAAGMLDPLLNWRDYTEDHQDLMLAQLRRIRYELHQALAAEEIGKSDAKGVLDKLDKALPQEDSNPKPGRDDAPRPA